MSGPGAQGPEGARGFDPTRPTAARVYDCLLDGSSGFAADRDLADRLLKICPRLGDAARENRAFIARAVTWAARQGISQFADLGTGMPPVRAGMPEDVHVTARAASPLARVAYVDNDPVVVAHSRVFRGAAGGVAVAEADLTDPAAVLAHPGLLEVIDPAAPVCLILGLVLGLMLAGRAREVVAGYAQLIASGSYVIVSCAHLAADLAGQLAAEVGTAAAYSHSPGDVGSILGGLELVPPGITAAQSWRGGWHDVPTTSRPLSALAAVGRKAVS